MSLIFSDTLTIKIITRMGHYKAAKIGDNYSDYMESAFWSCLCLSEASIGCD